MQAPFGASTPPTLAVCGWTERTSDLLRALEARGLTPVAIGDPCASSLVVASIALRGRRESLARYQHPREMLRRGPGAAVLLDLPDAAMEAAAAAARGTAVLVTGDAIEADTLAMLARAGAVAATVRPLEYRAPIAAAIAESRALPPLVRVALTVEEPREARAIADDLVLLASHFIDRPLRRATASAYRAQRGETGSVVTELEFSDGGTALLTARHAERVHLDLHLVSSGASVTAEGDGFGGTVQVTRGGHATTTRVLEVDRYALAVADALDVLARGGVEADRLFADAAILRALAAALDGVQPAPRLEVLTGGARSTERRRGHLQVVGV